MKKIRKGNLKRIFLSPPHIGTYEMKFIKEAFASNYIAPVGSQIDNFEKEFAKKIGISNVVAVSSGTASMHLALRILDIGQGDEIIAPTLTFIGGISPVIYQGGTLTFIDSDTTTWNMDPDLLLHEIEFRKRKGRFPKAVITADIFGQCVDLDRIKAICDKYNIPIISDSAESLGSTFKKQHAGVGATIAIYSFNGNKILTTSGGGLLASENEKLVAYAKFLATQACDNAPHYEHSQIGYNYRMSNVLAAIGRGQLRVLDERVKSKHRIFEYYKKHLSISGIKFMPEAKFGCSNRWLSVILIDPIEFGADRDHVRSTLENENIESRTVWKPMHMQPVFRGCKIRGGSVSEDLFKRGLCLPSGTAMTREDLDRIIDVILKSRR